jgi:hypothetical protein
MLINIWRIIHLLPNYSGRATIVFIISALFALSVAVITFLYEYQLNIVFGLLYDEVFRSEAPEAPGNYLFEVVSVWLRDELYQNDAVWAFFICLSILAVTRVFIVVLSFVHGRSPRDAALTQNSAEDGWQRLQALFKAHGG